MICTLDANAVITWSNPKADKLLLAALDCLLEEVGRAKGVILLPTPVLAELLVSTEGATANWLAALQKKSSIRIAPFDLRAAMECAFIDRLASASGGKRAGTKKNEAYQKIKVDRQIAAIAKSNHSDLVITNDGGLATICQFIGIPSKTIEALDVPNATRQTSLLPS